MNKLYVGMMVYNAGPILQSCIESTINHVDGFCIVDGSRFGPSTDGSLDIIKKFGSKITFYEAGTWKLPSGAHDFFGQEKVYLKGIPKEFDCWVLSQDADEAYSEDGIRRVVEAIQSAPDDVGSFSVRWNHFIGSPHFIGGDEYWHTAGRTPIFRHEQLGKVLRYKVLIPGVYVYHYSMAQSKERQRFRVQEYLKRGEYAKDGYPADTPWEVYYKEVWEKYENDPLGSSPAVPFTGEHPEAIKRHSLEIFGEQL